MFVVFDERHDEAAGAFTSLAAAVNHVRELATIRWDREPNVAPCASWRTCGRNYEIVEFDESMRPRREVRRIPAFAIDAAGVRWAEGFGGIAAQRP